MSHHQDDIIHRSIVAYLRWNGHHSVADAVTKAHVAGPSIPDSVANADADPDPVRRAKVCHVRTKSASECMHCAVAGGRASTAALP